jgi:hypothetical protein
VSTEEILDHILVPRPNGSEALEQVAAFLAERLASSGALVSFHAFTATPHGFALRRYRSPDRLVAFVNETARGLWGAPLRARELPPGTLTDGRSFLAHGLPALTLRAFTPEGFPRLLHSEHDSRERLSISAIERSVELLRAIVARADADPTLGGALPRSERR